MSNTERRWSKWDGHYLYYWVDNKCQLCISLRSIKCFKIPNPPDLKDAEIDGIITDDEAKKILLELFWRKYPNGWLIPFGYTSEQKKPKDSRVIFKNEMAYIDCLNSHSLFEPVPFLNLTTGKWADGVEEDSVKVGVNHYGGWINEHIDESQQSEEVTKEWEAKEFFMSECKRDSHLRGHIESMNSVQQYEIVALLHRYGNHIKNKNK